MSLDDVSCVADAIIRGFTPDPIYNLSEWSDNFRVLSSKASSEPGKWRTSRTPYLKKIMEALSSDATYERVVFMKASQIGGSEVGNNWIGYTIDKCPAPIMIVQPTVDMAKKFSKQRIDPMIEETDVLRGKIVERKSRDAGNTMMMKTFEGGLLMLTGANSATGLRSMAIKNLYMDEIDAYSDDVNGEGSPIDLAIKRTATFSKRKIYLVSSPTTEHASKIEKIYQGTDQNKYFVPCPKCGEFQLLEFEHIRFEKLESGAPDLKTVRYKCVSCNELIPEHKKTEMLLRGEWRAMNPDKVDRKTIGFHLNSLYSPVGWYSWTQAVIDYHEAAGNPMKMKTFVNTVLGETWKDKGDAPDWRRLYDRREDYKIGTIPAGVCVLTAAVDVQKDRLMVEIKGWARSMRSWSVDYRMILGDTSGVEVWKQLEQVLSEEFTHEAGPIMRISKMVIDSGYNTQSVYRFCQEQNPSRVMAVKGADNLQTIISHPKNVTIRTDGRKQRSGCKLFMMGSSVIKHEVYAWLRAESPLDGESDPFGYARFPEYDTDFFRGLASEQLVQKKHNGYDKFYWQKIYDRNEPLDLFVMNRVAAYALGLDRWKGPQWDKIEGQFRIVKDEAVTDNKSAETKKAVIEMTKPKIKRRESSFF